MAYLKGNQSMFRHTKGTSNDQNLFTRACLYHPISLYLLSNKNPETAKKKGTPICEIVPVIMFIDTHSAERSVCINKTSTEQTKLRFAILLLTSFETSSIFSARYSAMLHYPSPPQELATIFGGKEKWRVSDHLCLDQGIAKRP